MRTIKDKVFFWWASNLSFRPASLKILSKSQQSINFETFWSLISLTRTFYYMLTDHPWSEDRTFGSPEVEHKVKRKVYAYC